MSKTTKKNKSNKVNLAVKVHSSATKIKRKKAPISKPALSQETEKKKLKARKKVFKKKKPKKSKGLLLEETKKEDLVNVSENIHEENNKRRSFFTYSEGEEKAKLLLMRSGVTFFMLLIFVMWIYNAKRNIVRSAPHNSESNILKIESWQEIKKDISDKMQKIKNETEESQTLDLEEKRKEIDTSPALKDKLINISSSSEQKEKLKEGMNKILK